MSSSNQPRWHKGRDSRESAELKRHRLLLEEEHSEWVVEIHSGCKKNDAIRKTKFGKQEQHLSCYDKIAGKRCCFSSRTLVLFYLRNNEFLEPPTFQNTVKLTTGNMIDQLMKRMAKINLKEDEEQNFEEQFSKYLGGQLPTDDIHCCPTCFEEAREKIDDDVVDPLKLFAQLGINGEVRLLQSCFLTRDKLESHMDIVHNVNNEPKSEMKLTLDRFMLRESDGLVDQYCHTLGANFRNYYWDLNRVKTYLGVYEHLKKADSKTCPTWKRLHGVIDENPKASDDEFISSDSEAETVATDEEWSSSSESDSEEAATVVMESPSKRKRYAVDSESESESESDTEVEFIDVNRCCVHCVGVAMERMSIRNYGYDKIFCDGGNSCPLNGDPLGALGLFYGCNRCKEYDLCEDCYQKH